MFATAGAQIIEVVDMNEIAAEKQYEFAFLGLPLKLRGATGAPMPSYAVPLRELSRRHACACARPRFALVAPLAPVGSRAGRVGEARDEDPLERAPRGQRPGRG